MILVDTSVLIDFFQGKRNPSVHKFKDYISKGFPFGITSSILQELLQGTKSKKDFNQLKRYLETQKFFYPKDAINTFIQAAKLYKKCRSKGFTPRGSIDCLIAQIAIENGLSLLHNDKDFDRIAKASDLTIF